MSSIIIDASHCKVPPHAVGAVGGNQQIIRTKGGSTPKYTWPWMRMVCRLESLLLKVPGGYHGNCWTDDGLATQALLADKAYDVKALIQKACDQGIEVVIPPKKNCKEQCPYDKELYK